MTVESSDPKVYPVELIAQQLEVLEARTLWEKKEKHITGLITGCFDILHTGQVEFLRRAKGVVDTLVVGVDRDETVALKGIGRPVFGLKQRCEMLAALDSVDLVFPIPFVLKAYEETSDSITLYEELTKKLFNLALPTIGVHLLISNELTDQFWQEKARRADKMEISYWGLKMERPTSSTEVVTKIQKGF
jgi:cytidyltransferase-like protein